MNSFVELLLHVASVFERTGARYAYVGSVASSSHGLPRATNDIDLITDLSFAQVSDLIGMLGDDFYFDEDAIHRALRTRRSFNLIHQTSLIKVDVFSLTPGGFGYTSLARRSLEPAMRGSDSNVYMVTAEDTLLAKLEWFKKGGGTSDRQWSDITGIIKVRGASLDTPYLYTWAVTLGVSDLLEKAFAEAG